MLADDGTVFDLSGHVDDFGPNFFADDSLEKVARTVTQDLPRLDLGKARVGPPISRPFKIIGIGLNYEDHARESGMEIPSEPVVFMKATNALSGPNDNILLPLGATKVDWE